MANFLRSSEKLASLDSEPPRTALGLCNPALSGLVGPLKPPLTTAVRGPVTYVQGLGLKVTGAVSVRFTNSRITRDQAKLTCGGAPQALVSSGVGMNSGRGSGLGKQLAKAAGEAFVAYKLSRRGWLVVNANSGVQNMPNFDLIAMRGDHRITIQVKATTDASKVRLGAYQPEGAYFNTKDGTEADVVAFVRLGADEDDEIFFLPATEANRIAAVLGDYHAARKRKSGASMNFPIMCRVKGSTESPAEIEAMERMIAFKDADIV